MPVMTPSRTARYAPLALIFAATGASLAGWIPDALQALAIGLSLGFSGGLAYMAALQAEHARQRFIEGAESFLAFGHERMHDDDAPLDDDERAMLAQALDAAQEALRLADRHAPVTTKLRRRLRRMV
jgi:hypothetical protein